MLSDAWLKANSGKLREKVEVVNDRDGMSARLTAKGKIIFQMRYRYSGSARRMDLGSYPLMSLKKARAECLRLRAKLEQGYDPKIVKQLEKQSRVEDQSIEYVFRQWYANYCKKNKKIHTEILRSFEIYLFPSIGSLPINQAKLHDWMTVLDPLAISKPAIAERLLTNSKQMLNWALRRQIIENNHLSQITAKADLNVKKSAGDRSLSDDEVKWVWFALDKSRMAMKNKLFLKLCLIYGCRNGELRLSKKEDFDFENEVWTVPKGNHKLGKATGKPLLRPIIDPIRPYLEQAILLSKGSDYLFTNSGDSDVMGRGAPLPLPYNIMQWLRKNKEYEMQHWSVHDLRKTARTNFSTLTQPHVAEIMLGHKLPGVWQVYDQYDYLSEQREAYGLWCERLSKIVG